MLVRLLSTNGRTGKYGKRLCKADIRCLQKHKESENDKKFGKIIERGCFGGLFVYTNATFGWKNNPFVSRFAIAVLSQKGYNERSKED